VAVVIRLTVPRRLVVYSPLPFGKLSLPPASQFMFFARTTPQLSDCDNYSAGNLDAFTHIYLF